MTSSPLIIDVGYSQDTRTTGLCLLTLDDTHIRWRCRNTGTPDDVRLEALRSLVPVTTRLLGVGVDGPLASSLQTVNHHRSADALLTRDIFQRRCKLVPINVPVGQCLHRHATKLARIVIHLRDQGHLTIASASHPQPVWRDRIVEALPTAFLAVLLSDDDFPKTPSPRKAKSDTYWRIAVEKGYLLHLVDTLAPGRALDPPLESITDHDHLAAFVCALTALCVDQNQYVAVGDPMYGDIILPPSGSWGASAPHPWPEIALRKTVASVRGDGGRHPGHVEARVLRNGTGWF